MVQERQRKIYNGTPCNERPLLNPTRPENWPPKPKTPKELERWMVQTKGALLEWLTSARGRAQDSPCEKKISEYTKRFDNVWQGFESKTDMQTGTIYKRSDQIQMICVMEEQKQARKQLHESLATWHHYTEYKYAEASWEDFLFYQNVWNRKGFDPDQQFYITKIDRDIARRMAKKGEAKAFVTSRADEVAHRNPSASPSVDEPWFNKELVDDFFAKYYCEWRNHVIELYIKFKLGYRKHMPEVIDPEIAHRYSQSIRDTTNQSSERGRQRSSHLDAQFPRRKRKNPRAREVEERSVKKTRKAENDRSGSDMWEPIEWRLDDEACKRIQGEKELIYRKDPCTKALLPANHVLHHGCLETSFDWPTSFDSPAWGDSVSVTAIRRKYVFEKIPGAEDISDDKKMYKRNVEGKKIIKLDTRPRYRKVSAKRPRKVFTYGRNDDGTVVGRHRDGYWLGHWEDREIGEEEFEVTGNNIRTRLPARYCIENEFRILIVPAGDLPGFERLDIRPDRPEEGGKRAEWSASEEEDCVSANANFEWSATNNPDQADTRSEGEESGSSIFNRGDTSNDNDPGSEVEGDLFTLSYEEYLTTNRARKLLAQLE